MTIQQGACHDEARPRVAPAWHTALLVGLILAVFVTGTATGMGAATPKNVVVGAYVPMLAVAWMLAIYVARVGRGTWRLAEIVRRPKSILAEAAIGLLCALAVVAFEGILGPTRSAATILPRSPAEIAVWGIVAVSVGVSEEMVYRGYLRTQLAAFTGSATAAVVLQAILFGLAHAAQGPSAALRIGLYGLFFGAVADARGTLAPVIVAHVAIDLAAAL